MQDLERQNSTGPLIGEGRNEKTGTEIISDTEMVPIAAAVRSGKGLQTPRLAVT